MEGSEDTYLLNMVGVLYSMKFKKKKSTRNPTCAPLPTLSVDISSEYMRDLGQQWGLWENIEKTVQRAKIVIIAQSEFTLEMR